MQVSRSHLRGSHALSRLHIVQPRRRCAAGAGLAARAASFRQAVVEGARGRSFPRRNFARPRAQPARHADPRARGLGELHPHGLAGGGAIEMGGGRVRVVGRAQGPAAHAHRADRGRDRLGRGGGRFRLGADERRAAGAQGRVQARAVLSRPVLGADQRAFQRPRSALSQLGGADQRRAARPEPRRDRRRGGAPAPQDAARRRCRGRGDRAPRRWCQRRRLDRERAKPRG